MPTIRNSFDQIELVFTPGKIYRLKGKMDIAVAYTTDPKTATREVNGVTVISVPDDARGGTITTTFVFHPTATELLNEVWTPSLVSPRVVQVGELVLSDLVGSSTVLTATSATLASLRPGQMQPGDSPLSWQAVWSGIINMVAFPQNTSAFGPFVAGSI